MRASTILAVLLLLTGACTADEQSPGNHADPDVRMRLSVPRAVHEATRLDDGSVLLTGGCTEPGCGGFHAGRTAETIDARGDVASGPQMTTSRASGTATLLLDGRVLMAGGYPGEGQTPTASAETYVPREQRFVPVGAMSRPRADQSASLLADGRVVMAGGFDGSGRALADTEIFDPRTGRFSPGPRLSAPRAAHVAVTVDDLAVLIGGTVDAKALATTEVMREGSWKPGPRLLTPRVKLGAAPLPDGRVLVIGGATETEGRDRLATTELLSLRTRQGMTPGPELAQGEYKLDGAIASLPDGRVVIPSGDGLEIFDPATDRLRRLPGTTYGAGSFRTVTALGPDRVLVAGGYDADIVPTDESVLVTIPSARS